jgi:hypothetical protein
MHSLSALEQRQRLAHPPLLNVEDVPGFAELMNIMLDQLEPG